MARPRPSTTAAAIALAVALAAAAAAAPISLLTGTELTSAGELLLAPCETQLIDLGRPAAAWALRDGFYPGERNRQGTTFAWTRQRATLRVIVTGAGERSLTIRARPGPRDDQTVRALWNGVDLGEQPLPRGWTEVTWSVPAGAVRLGRNDVALIAGTRTTLPAGGREVGLCLDRVRSTRPGARCERTDVETATAAPLVLPEEAALSIVRHLPPAASLELELAGPPEAAAEVVVARGDGSRTVGRVRAGAGAQTVSLGGCGGAAEVSIVRRGPGSLTVAGARLAGDESHLRWRHCCGAWWVYALVALLGAGLILACRRLRPRLPFAGAAPWVDAAFVFALALAVRWLFLQEYPAVDWRRFGDAWEYLNRARDLARGGISILGDTSWHAWQSWIRPPGYYLFLALALGRWGGLTGMAQIQVVLTAVAAAAVQLMAYPLFGRRAALLSGLLMAFYAEAVLSVVWILTEPLYLFLLVPGLAALAWVSRRPTLPLALSAGVLLGLATLVRSAPIFFVPCAAVLLVVAHGWRRARRPAAGFLVAFVLVVGPWCVRNSILYGAPVLVDDLAIPNFLYSHPDSRYVEHEDLDLTSPEDRREYWYRVKTANEEGWLTRRGGLRIVLGGMLRMARDPGPAVATAGRNLAEFSRTFPHDYVQVYLGERRPCRIVYWTDAMNAGYLVSLGLGLLGIAWSIRDRRVWPLLAWLVLNTVVVTVLFFPSMMPGRFRLGLMPVVMLFAGPAAERLLFGRRDSEPPPESEKNS